MTVALFTFCCVNTAILIKCQNDIAIGNNFLYNNICISHIILMLLSLDMCVRCLFQWKKKCVKQGRTNRHNSCKQFTCWGSGLIRSRPLSVSLGATKYISISTTETAITYSKSIKSNTLESYSNTFQAEVITIHTCAKGILNCLHDNRSVEILSYTQAALKDLHAVKFDSEVVLTCYRTL